MPGDSHRIRGVIEAPIVRLALIAAGLALLAGVAALAGRASGIDGDSEDSSGGMVEHGAPGEETGAGNGLSDTASGLRLAVDLTLAEPGAWRAYAGFERDGEKTVIGRDLVVPGSFVPRALPAPASTSPVDDYRVRLGTGELRAGAESTVEFSITRAGQPVALEPYLGADGHLVAIREDDLAYLHVHPLESSPASGVAFDSEFADPGRYALFLQFRDEGRVRTVSFTVEVAG